MTIGATRASSARSPTIATESNEHVPQTQAEADAQWNEITDYIKNHPGDFAGLDALTQEITGESIKVAVSDAGTDLTGAQAQAIIDDRAVLPEGATPQSKTTVSPMAVPSDAFTVSFAMIPRPNIGVYNKAGYGTWDIRDDYVNYSDPDDVASIRFEENNCLSMDNSSAQTYTYDGQATNAAILKDAGLNTLSPIFTIDDNVSGFVGNADHGWVMTDWGKHCGPSTFRGMFTYEHNQDGGSVAGISASFFGFSVNYNGNPATLQKSSPIVSFE
ncbi:hypothetical protein ACFJGV_14480 [Cnuibacter sp. UC19_7]|uniref:hypothetical protein n=1 Tax=Cnuibacter sp. UC19_7 TaxID=3350166 RepID=UPI003672FB2C